MDLLSNPSIKSYKLRRILVSLFSLIGLTIMAYLTYIHYANAKSFCDLSETISCDVVTTSLYSEIFGLPVSLLGLGYFGLVLWLIVTQKGREVFQTLYLLTLFVLVPSLYLSLVEVFIIKAFCLLCETSKALMLAIAAVSLLATKLKAKELLRMSIPVVVAGLAAALVTYFAQTGTVVRKDYTAFVEALNNNGLVYYKSFRCNTCKRQERLFGEAYLKLNSVECHPEGPGGNPELCLQKKIEHTPTFILEEGAHEVKRLVGLQSLESLAKFAGVSPSFLE